MADVNEFFTSTLPAKLAESNELAEEINAIYQFDIGGAGSWTVDLTGGKGEVREGPCEEPGCVVTAEQEDFETLLTNPESGMMLFTMGKLMVTDVALALQIQRLLE